MRLAKLLWDLHDNVNNWEPVAFRDVPQTISFLYQLGKTRMYVDTVTLDRYRFREYNDGTCEVKMQHPVHHEDDSMFG